MHQVSNGPRTILNRGRARDAAGHVIVKVIPVNIEVAIVVLRATILGNCERILLVHLPLVARRAVARAVTAAIVPGADGVAAQIVVRVRVVVVGGRVGGVQPAAIPDFLFPRRGSARVLIGGLVGNFAEGLGLVRTEGGLVIVVVAEVGCRVILGRGLRAILKIDRVCCCGGAKRLTFGDSGGTYT